MSARVDAAERLLALVIALTHTSHRMTKSQIRSSVAGYSGAGSTEAFDRMFERDKDTLRGLGVPLVTLTDPAHPDDVGYRIDTSEYALPAVDFTPAEVGVVSLAAAVWQDSTLSVQARRALTKLRAVSVQAVDTPADVALRVQGPDEVFDDLFDAVVAAQAVRFDYRAANTGTLATREVEPWRLFAKDRGWYLVGFDRDRGAQRSFRLSRIAGRVRRTGPPGAVQAPPEPGAAAAPTATDVTLAIKPGRAAALRARAEPGNQTSPTTSSSFAGRDLITLRTDDPEQLADDIVGYGSAVLVVQPEHLRTSVLRRLTAIAKVAQRG